MKHQQRIFKKQNLSPCRTQLWQSVPPFEEYSSSPVAILSSGKSSEKTGVKEQFWNPTVDAVDFLLPRSFGLGTDIHSNHAMKHMAIDPGSRGRQVQSYRATGGIRDRSKLATTAPTRSAVGIPRIIVGASAQTPPHAPSRTIVAHTSSMQTLNMTPATTSLLGSAHHVPIEIHIPGTARSGADEERENPTRDHSIEVDDECSEVSLDQELSFMKLGDMDTSDPKGEKSGGNGVSSPSSTFSTGPTIDRTLFPEACDLAVDLYPPLSHFHSSVTTPDSLWGITTATLDEADDSSWPSDEERAPEKDRNSKNTKVPRRGRFKADSLRLEHEDHSRDAAPSTMAWEHLSCNAGWELCSAGQVRQSFFYPVFPGKEIPWKTHRTTTAATDPDDGQYRQWRHVSSKRGQSSKSFNPTRSMNYEERQLSSIHTHTTEESLSMENSGSFIV